MQFPNFITVSLFGVLLVASSASGQLGSVVGGVTGSAGGALNTTGGALNANVGSAATGALDTSRGAPTVTSLTQSAELSSRFQSILPPGTTIADAAGGFSSSADFMTAAYAAHNLGIPFVDLRQKVIGKKHLSLEKALRELKPDAEGQAIRDSLKLAERQTDRDFRLVNGERKDSVAAKIGADASLSAQAAALLPPGSDVVAAAKGFDNRAQFFSTAQASHDLKLPFAEMKDRVTAGQSLSEAIRALNPGMTKADADASAKASVSASVR